MSAAAKIDRIDLFLLEMKLKRPYRVSFETFYGFEPLIAVIHDRDGNIGFSEAVITEGYSHENTAGGWAFLSQMADDMIGKTPGEALETLDRHIGTQPTAGTVMYAAVEMLGGSPFLVTDRARRIPLLEPIHTVDLDEIEQEVEQTLASGFRTLKVKVGFDVESDLRRVAKIQEATKDRAKLRLDANRGFSVDDGCAFARALNPLNIELFEQPCGSDEWAENAAVARVSSVPIMLDESVYGTAEIERASDIEGVGFIKLKMKKMGGLEHLATGLRRIRQLGMTPVVGDGTATEIGCWQEACVAESLVSNAGEMNGYLKYADRLLRDPLRFEDGSIRIEPNWRPELDLDAVRRLAVKSKMSRTELVRGASF